MFERDAPLFFNWDHRPYWPHLKQEIGCDETGAAILTSLYAADRPLSYSRNKNSYRSPNRYKNGLWTYKKVTSSVDALGQGGLVLHRRSPPGSLGWQSSVRLTSDCRAYLGEIIGDTLAARSPSETIILRTENKALADYRDCPKTRRMRRTVSEVNEAIAGSRLMGCRPCPLVRIFNQTFGRGGRFYAAGGGWQCMNKLSRGQILIDGEPVVEIDYTSLHATLVYHLAGVPKPSDCYCIDGWPRVLVKLAFLILLNARTENSAVRAIANNEEMADWCPNFSDAFSQAKNLVSVIKCRHQAIARFFHSDAGASLMRADSDMAEIVMARLNRHGIVALPVHDSFLVQAKFEEELKEAMLGAAHSQGFTSVTVQ